MAETDTGILGMLEETDWEPSKGRAAEPSPYGPAIAKSVAEGYKAFAFTVNVGTDKSKHEATGKTKQEAELVKHVNLLRKAAREQKPVPVTVLVQAGDIAKNGDVRIQFKTREKIKKAAKTAAPAAA